MENAVYFTKVQFDEVLYWSISRSIFPFLETVLICAADKFITCFKYIIIWCIFFIYEVTGRFLCR